MNDELEQKQFFLRAYAIVWSIFYSDKEYEMPLDEFYVLSYASAASNKCALIGTRSNPSMSYEVTYDANAKRTHVISYIEQERYSFTDDELNDQKLH
jgi:hypothetical protein